MKNLKITTSEIARICGVSQGTVDRALNNRSDIKAATKKKILDVARQYGYREHIIAPPEKIVGQIGVIIFNLNNDYFSHLVTELEYVFRTKGLCTTVMMSHYDRQNEIECIRNMYNMGADGIVLCPVNGGAEFENYLKLFDIPVVTIGNQLPYLPYVGIDDFAAMADMTNMVLNENPEEIIYFSPALTYHDASAQRKRYEGFLSTVGNHKYSVVTKIEDIKESYSEKTTIICSNDHYALKAYFKTKNAKVVGFDNINALEKYKLPIDSVGFSMPEIAAGVANVINKKKNDNVIIKHYIEKHT